MSSRQAISSIFLFCAKSSSAAVHPKASADAFGNYSDSRPLLPVANEFGACHTFASNDPYGDDGVSVSSLQIGFFSSSLRKIARSPAANHCLTVWVLTARSPACAQARAAGAKSGRSLSNRAMEAFSRASPLAEMRAFGYNFAIRPFSFLTMTFGIAFSWMRVFDSDAPRR